MTDQHKIEAYCVRCRGEAEVNPTPVFTAKGQPAVQGTCAVCGTKVFRMGETPMHAGMTAPPKPAPPKLGQAGHR